MRIAKIIINNFRGIKKGEFNLPNHGVLVGDNNVGKSTLLEAIDLVLGPERMRKKPVIDEHDFFAGDYLNLENLPIEINIEVIVIDLNEEQETYFKDHIEWWDINTNTLLNGPPPESTDANNILSAIRFVFNGKYNEDEDDFIGNTYFKVPLKDNGERIHFTTKDKRICGFLFLRTLRTGSRALSLERGSLLDIILSLNEVKLNMWEELLEKLREIPVADNPELGLVNILSNVQDELSSLVTSDWGTDPQIKVSDLTREGLRKTLNVFMETGVKNIRGKKYIAPFKKQGTGTVNMLLLSMLSIIANLKKNVIFAMEEPEIAIPPHTQKRIINSIREKSAQALFTSHSPYILEEFDPSEIVVFNNNSGFVSSKLAEFPKDVKKKNYKQEFRKKYCEALLAKRVLIVEGKTEYDAIPAVARRLHELNPNEFSNLEALGIAIINAETDSKIATIASHLKNLGKITLAIYDKQNEGQRKEIVDNVSHSFESPEKGFEDLVLKHIPFERLKVFTLDVVSSGNWPKHLLELTPSESINEDQIKDILSKYFNYSKGSGSTASLLETCNFEEVPEFIKDTLKTIKSILQSESEASFPVQSSSISTENNSDHRNM